VRVAAFFLAGVLAGAQGMPQLIERGQEVYAKSCATGYCHGVKGAAGGAPRLASRGFDETYIMTVTRSGVKGTAMQAFGTMMPRGDLMAVVAYVSTLNGIANPSLGRGGIAAGGDAPQRQLPAEAARGRALFFDSLRGFAKCSTCHQADGMGIPVTTPISTIPESAAALRALTTAQVKTATAAGESFPVLVVTQGARESKLYDLTMLPPVLRTLPSPSVKVADGSAWKHSSAIANYQDAELDAVLAFLRAVAAPQK
jgi:mono/diheme cytochrome c family protein